MSTHEPVSYQTDPAHYRHWRLEVDGPVATLWAQFDEDGGLRPGYKLKLNSYDLGVDIELHDALNRVRFEHPQVGTVVITSARDKVFCSGANIFMLGLSSHAWKVNFCKFTNETRNGMEDSSAHDGIRFLAGVNGACAGGGYELALACDEIMLVDDRSSAVSLPEVPLLGVLPGTGGLTRVTDKRHVRHDHADLFCTSAEGVRGERALQWRLVDTLVKPAAFAQRLRERALELAAQNARAAEAVGVRLQPLVRDVQGDALNYRHVQVQIDRERRTASICVLGPKAADLTVEPSQLQALGDAWYPLAMARELDDAILHLRTNEPEIGIWLLRTKGQAQAVLDMDALMDGARDHWLVRQTTGLMRRTLSRLDVSARSLFALIEPDSCFAGTLLELALACDRSYMLDLSADDAAAGPCLVLGARNFGAYPMATGQSRLQRRFYGDDAVLQGLRAQVAVPQTGAQALALGLVTAAPDDIDWADEVRIAIEERASMSPDALTGLEANLRFNGPENMVTRIFGRLSAWQNWIFQRPNAVGEKGALKVYGKGEKAAFDWNRV
ncbi:MAG: 2,3-epoxybenzoyl-CoA dihydrolase [Rhodoferax sp.]